jgi:hypothetical protein
MASIMIDGHRFDGPMALGKDPIPAVRAVALVCTEAGEGMKIMSVVHGENVAEAIAKSPKQDCWKAHAHLGRIDVYVMPTEMNESDREAFRIKIISKRSDFIFCDELPKVEDDW